METEVFDCAIVGGGPAGLTLAIQLADAGQSVVLFEKEKYPFHKVCGEYVSLESCDFLERMEVPLSSMDLPGINEVGISSPRGNFLTRKLDMGGMGISRYTLDHTLAKIAAEKGALVLENNKVTDVTFDGKLFLIHASSGAYHARVACGAYGRKASLDRILKRSFNRAGRRNYLAVKYHMHIDFPANRIELHNFKNGYCGISKVDGGRYCLCYLTDSENLKKNGNNIKQMERNVLMQNPFLEKYFTEAVFLNERPYTLSQITFKAKSTVEEHVLMLGDSAATIAPLCGNGMSMAMHASSCAFPLIEKYIRKSISREQLEYAYTKQWNEHFSKRVKAGRHIQGLFGRGKFTDISIGVLKHLPVVTDKLIGLTHGETF